MLRGRRDECAVLDRLVEGARAGRSGVLVLRGEAGVGKTARLDYAIGSAEGLWLLRAVGVEAEIELPRGLLPTQLAGGFGLPGALSLQGSIQENFAARLEALPADTQRLLLVAAAERTGDPALLWRAAGRLGLTPGGPGSRRRRATAGSATGRGGTTGCCAV